MVIGKCTVVFRGFFLCFGGGVEGRGLCGRGGGYAGGSSLEKYIMGEQKFNEKGAGFSKITIKINMEKYFQLKVKSSIET